MSWLICLHLENLLLTVTILGSIIENTENYFQKMKRKKNLNVLVVFKINFEWLAYTSIFGYVLHTMETHRDSTVFMV